MKNKITTLFFVISLTSFGAFAQSGKDSQGILSNTNIERLNTLEKEITNKKGKEYKVAEERAIALNMPVSGVNEKGEAFHLMGLDDVTGELLYYSTSNNTPTNSSLQTANAKPLQVLGITGKNVTTAVWDGGVASNNHVSLKGRIIVKDNGNSGMTASGIDHAAHVTGTVAANAQIVNAKGFATEATVWAYNFGNDSGEMAAAAKLNLLVSNHSYGLDSSKAGSVIPGIYGRYNTQSAEYDEIANAAPYYTMVFAAGNDRDPSTNPGGVNYNPTKGGRDLLSQGGTSKNVVVVAATKGTEDFSGIATALSPTNFLTKFSNWGPTDDFRIKPDIAAKGGDVFSLSSSSITGTSTKSGTSMAAPAVTGVFVLWQQYFNQIFSQYMKSATVRAMMAHTAKEAGEAEGPDYKFGWGLIDADAGAQVMREKSQKMAVIAELSMGQSQSLNYDFEYDGNQPLIATIAWNDPAGSPLNTTNVNIASLVNDLDIKVVNLDTNAEYLPWALQHNWNSSGSGIAARMVNSRDNIERVNVPVRTAGNYRVVVSHKGTLKAGSQDFSIIISGSGVRMKDLGTLSTEERAFTKLNLYPNPTVEVVNLEGDREELNGASIGIYNLNGAKVYEQHQLFDGVNSERIDVSQLQSGTYLLDIVNKDRRQVLKFIKK